MVVFVIGPSGAGKSTYIAKNFPNYKKVDLWDFQKDNQIYEGVWRSYERCCDALIEAVKNEENVVLEHTLLKSMRRPMYIDAVRKVYDGPIDVVCIIPDNDKLAERRSKKFKKEIKPHDFYDLKIFEMPQEGDGFRNITVVEGDF